MMEHKLIVTTMVNVNVGTALEYVVGVEGYLITAFVSCDFQKVRGGQRGTTFLWIGSIPCCLPLIAEKNASFHEQKVQKEK